jgi:CheY-like chemotaxis protein
MEILMRILVVDDNSFGMKYVVQAIRGAGHVVELRSDAQKAFDAFVAYLQESSGNHWDGAILDVMFHMPEPDKRYVQEDPEGDKTGYLLLQDLRKHQPDLPVVILTNNRNPDTLGQLRRMPKVRIFRKLDQEPAEFVEALEEFLQAR